MISLNGSIEGIREIGLTGLDFEMKCYQSENEALRNVPAISSIEGFLAETDKADVELHQTYLEILNQVVENSQTLRIG